MNWGCKAGYLSVGNVGFYEGGGGGTSLDPKTALKQPQRHLKILLNPKLGNSEFFCLPFSPINPMQKVVYLVYKSVLSISKNMVCILSYSNSSTVQI
jgi:hypothetical protein